MPQFSLAEVAKLLSAQLRGDPETIVSGVATCVSAQPEDICYVNHKRYLADLENTKAAAVLVATDLASEIPSKFNCLLVSDVELSFIDLVNHLYKPPKIEAGVHPAATIDPSADVSDSASIAANVVIGPNTKIASGVQIDAGCVIAEHVSIDSNSIISANVTICAGTAIGQNTRIHSSTVIGGDGFGNLNRNGRWIKIPQLGRVIIGNDVEIGASVTIDRGALDDTEIADGVRIDNQVHIAHNVTVGENTAIAGATVVAGSVKIGANCMFGGSCSISGHLQICDGVMLTGSSTVSKSITKPGVYSSGQPAQSNAEWRRTVVHYRNLDKTMRRLRKLEEKINVKNDD